MATYIGFNTQGVHELQSLKLSQNRYGIESLATRFKVGKKFTLTDEQLVVRDLLNAFNIKQGDKVGSPGYGTTVWNYIFDPNVPEVINNVKNEIRRLINEDPRIELGNLNVYSQDHGILIEIEVYIKPFNNVFNFGLYLNTQTQSAQLLSQ